MCRDYPVDRGIKRSGQDPIDNPKNSRNIPPVGCKTTGMGVRGTKNLLSDKDRVFLGPVRGADHQLSAVCRGRKQHFFHISPVAWKVLQGFFPLSTTIFHLKLCRMFQSLKRALHQIQRQPLVDIRRHLQKVGIIGVPFSRGQKKFGVECGPRALRDGGLAQEITDISDEINLKDFGDVSYESKVTQIKPRNMLGYDDVVACNQRLSEKVFEILSDDRMCITLGGDHAIGIGSVDGHVRQKENIAIVWVDAHADLNTNTSSLSGNVHGMPLALLAEEFAGMWPYLPNMDWQVPRVSTKNIAYIGLRSVDDFEKDMIARYNITAFGMRDVDKYGIHDVINRALESIDPTADRSIHLSFDIDALNPLEAPSTGTSVPGGLALREGIHIVEEVHKTRRLSVMDLVEVNPRIGNEDQVKDTVNAGIEIIKAACGNYR